MSEKQYTLQELLKFIEEEKAVTTQIMSLIGSDQASKTILEQRFDQFAAIEASLKATVE